MPGRSADELFSREHDQRVAFQSNMLPSEVRQERRAALVAIREGLVRRGYHEAAELSDEEVYQLLVQSEKVRMTLLKDIKNLAREVKPTDLPDVWVMSKAVWQQLEATRATYPDPPGMMLGVRVELAEDDDAAAWLAFELKATGLKVALVTSD